MNQIQSKNANKNRVDNQGTIFLINNRIALKYIAYIHKSFETDLGKGKQWKSSIYLYILNFN